MKGLALGIVLGASLLALTGFRQTAGAPPAVDMSWAESAGFLRVVPITPSMGAGFSSDEWGVLFGPQISLGSLSGPSAPSVPAAPAAASAPSMPAGAAGLGPAIPGSAPAKPVNSDQQASGTAAPNQNTQPGDWAKSGDSDKINVSVVQAGQAAGSPVQAGQPAPTATAAAAPVQAAPPTRIAGAYVSWTPGVIYASGLVPTGSDLVISIDSKATGQPFGATDADFEVRIPGGTGQAIVRQAISGQLQVLPQWGSLVKTSVVPLQGMAGYELIQAEIPDPTNTYFPVKVGGQFAIRLDAVSPGTITALGAKRSLSLVEAVQSKGPNGLANVSGITYPGVILDGVNQFTAGQTPMISIEPKGNWPAQAQDISVTPIGAGSAGLTSMTLHSPNGLASSQEAIPYKVFVGDSAPLGYGAFVVKVGSTGGVPAEYCLPYQIVGPISIASHSVVLHSVDAPQKVKVQANLISNVKSSIHGVFSVDVPQGWQVDKGTDKSFVLYNINNKAVRDFMLTVPSSVPAGLYPVTLSASFGKTTVTKVIYVVIM